MPDERMYPILPCPDVDEAIAFYEALGFRRTYRQLRPNPAAVVERDAMAIHLAGIDGFDPQQKGSGSLRAIAFLTTSIGGCRGHPLQAHRQ